MSCCTPRWNFDDNRLPFGTIFCRRIFGPRDIIAMTLKYLTSVAESKDLHVQFGATASAYSYHVNYGIECIINCCIGHPDARVFWDRSIANMERCARRTSMFLDISGVVAMIDEILVSHEHVFML